MSFLHKLNAARDSHKIDKKIYEIFYSLYQSYAQALERDGLNFEEHETIFDTLLGLVIEQIAHPYPFEPYHQRITSPYNYFAFGLSFVRPLVDKERSRVFRLDNVAKIDQQIKKGENVILLSNHQTELDPQLISFALEEEFPELGEEMIFVAGDRVITDPLAIPFSMGRNLLCIYSKRHIDNPPEKKAEKQHHNQRTMKRMKELLAEGGKCIYVAPSGGRDRPNEAGEVVPAPFDPQSIEMFRLIGEQAGHPIHFYPLALATYDILPPPQTVQRELGEERKTARSGILLSFGNELDLEHFPGADIQDRHAKRSARAHHIWQLVNQDYIALKGYSP